MKAIIKILTVVMAMLLNLENGSAALLESIRPESETETSVVSYIPSAASIAKNYLFLEDELFAVRTDAVSNVLLLAEKAEAPAPVVVEAEPEVEEPAEEPVEEPVMTVEEVKAPVEVKAEAKKAEPAPVKEEAPKAKKAEAPVAKSEPVEEKAEVKVPVNKEKLVRSEIAKRGSYGRVYIEDVEVDIALFYVSMFDNLQSIVDAKDSACMFDWDDGNTIIADHGYQGFKTLKYCEAGTKAEIVTAEGTTTYICDEIIHDGYNRGEFLAYHDNTPISNNYTNSLIMYCCNKDDTIQITVWHVA